MKTSVFAVLGTLMAAIAIAPATAGASGDGRGVHIGSSSRATQLSNELTVTRIAYARRSAVIRETPRPGSRTNGRLNFLTLDGQALPYLALTKVTDDPGATWIEVRVPGRPNGQTGWVRASSLGSLRTVYGHLEVNRSTLRATLFGRHGQILFRAPAGLGRPGLRTPGGHFWITERLRSIGGAEYGPYAFGTSAYAPHLTDWPGGGVIGIHGTNEPGLIPGRPSHGCIRLRNRDVRSLRQRLDVGVPVLIK